MASNKRENSTCVQALKKHNRLRQSFKEDLQNAKEPKKVWYKSIEESNFTAEQLFDCVPVVRQ